MAKMQILVVEDEALVAEDIRRTLQNLGYTVPSTASSGEEAIKKAGEYKPDLVLMDIILKGDMDGIETARLISSRFGIPVIYLTAHSDKTTLDKAKITEPFGYIIKPFKEKELNMAISIAMYKYTTEKKLKESREWLSTILNSINDAVIATDAEGHVEFMNPLAQSLIGWKIEEAHGKLLQDIASIEDEKTKELSADFATHISEIGYIKDHQTLLFSRDKTKIPVEICGAPIKDDTGNVRGTVIIIRDITERELANEALRQSEEKYRTMFENAKDIIFTLSRKGIIVSLSPSFETVTGWKRSEWLDKPFALIVHRGDLPYANDLFQRAIQGETPPAKFELHIRLKSDDYILVEFTIAPQVQNGKVESLLGIARDITERKRAEEDLRLSEEKYRKLIENNQDGVFIIQDAKIQFANEAFAKIVGYTVEEIAGKDFREFVAPEDLDMVSERYFRRLADESVPKEYEFRILHRDGSRFIVNINVGLITYRGRVASMGTVKDITERKRAEEEILRRSQIQGSLNKLLQISLQDKSLEEILEQVIYHLTSIPWLAFESMGGIWLVDKNPNVLALKAQRGFPASLKTMCAHIPFGRCICGRAASSGKIEFANRIDERHENKYIDIAPHGHYCVPLLASGKVFGVINLFLKEGHRRDEKEEEFLIAISDVLVGIIQRKQAEEALRYSNDFSKTILNSMNDSISIIDVNNHEILGVNSVFLREAGLKEEDVIGKKCYEITHQRSDPCKPPKDSCPLLETVQTGKHSLTEHQHYRKNGKMMYVEVSTSPILDEEGGISRVVHVSRDVTERRLAEDRLKQANIELKKADELKTQFLSISSHELRTPLTPMRAQLQMILAGYFGEVTEKQKKSLDMVVRNTSRLDRLIGDILDISKLEAGVMTFIMAAGNLNEVVDNAIETMKPQAQYKNISMTLKEDKVPEMVFDRDRITQVVVNLLNNAIKFTESGGSIDVELSGNTDHAIVKVKDTGIGIKKEDQGRLFRPFEQVDSSKTRKYEGSGLGLAICKGIVEYHGGKIWMESEFGKGSTLQFTIPYKSKIKEETVELGLFEKRQGKEA